MAGGGLLPLWRRVRRAVNRRWIGLYNRQVAPRLGLVPKPLRVPLFFVELTNHCNLRCSMCPRPTLKRQLGHMDWDLYCRIIDNIARIGGHHVGLNRFGESLLYPRFLDAVRYAKQAGIGYVSVVTNGTRLDERMASEILDSGLDQLVVSLDTLDRETYEDIRRGARLDQVVANVDRVIRMREERGSASPQIQINAVLVKEDIDQLRALFAKYQDRVDRIVLKPCAHYGEGQDLGGDGVRRRRWLTCIQPWQRLNIFWNGDATVCCGDVEGDLVVGNVTQASLEWLWLKSPRALEIRRLHHRQDFDSLAVCRRCDAANADFFEQAVEQVKRVYTAVGLGDRVVGLQNTMPILRWHRGRGALRVTPRSASPTGPDELEP